MVKESVFYFYLFISIAWFYIGSLLVWRFALPELYRLFVKKENFSKHELLEKERLRKEKRQQKKKG